VDAQRPEALTARLRLVGRGRDIRTEPDGTVRVLDTVTTEVDIRFDAGPLVERVVTDPPVGGTEALTGSMASGGFRKVVNQSVSASPGSLLYLLLDETPGSNLVSGYALGHATWRGDLAAPQMTGTRSPGPSRQTPDLCAGWQVGGVILVGMEQEGRVPHVTGPDAPSVVDPADPDGWHAFPPLAPDEMRRARRCDVWRMETGDLGVDAFFRDSHMAPDGLETVLHEYTLRATVSSDASTVLSCEATPQVLPWIECPQAAASAGRLAGVPLSGLRSHVRSELVGKSTCTHLNDTLRELEDLLTLARHID